MSANYPFWTTAILIYLVVELIFELFFKQPDVNLAIARAIAPAGRRRVWTGLLYAGLGLGLFLAGAVLVGNEALRFCSLVVEVIGFVILWKANQRIARG